MGCARARKGCREDSGREGGSGWVGEEGRGSLGCHFLELKSPKELLLESIFLGHQFSQFISLWLPKT